MLVPQSEVRKSAALLSEQGVQNRGPLKPYLVYVGSTLPCIWVDYVDKVGMMWVPSAHPLSPSGWEGWTTWPFTPACCLSPYVDKRRVSVVTSSWQEQHWRCSVTHDIVMCFLIMVPSLSSQDRPCGDIRLCGRESMLLNVVERDDESVWRRQPFSVTCSSWLCCAVLLIFSSCLVQMVCSTCLLLYGNVAVNIRGKLGLLFPKLVHKVCTLPTSLRGIKALVYAGCSGGWAAQLFASDLGTSHFITFLWGYNLAQRFYDSLLWQWRKFRAAI